MPSHDVSQTSARGQVVPPCTNCQLTAHVHPVVLQEMSPGVEYWRCAECGFLWATYDGEDLRVF
jgi:hypothetical protein